MIRKVRKQHSKQEILDLLEPLVRQWFDTSFDELTEPQSFAVPLIHERKNVLVSSPTGSGKTITAFLSIINELLILQKKGKLEDKIYCVYISPLKALANDINRNLTTPLEEMRQIALKEGLEPPEIKVAVRSGDTSPSERQRMARKPPHIFITTPESLALVLTAPKFRKKLADTKWVIVDEIHEICSSKRGVHLSLSLERLREQIGRDFTRIGLSATIAPINEIAKFLVGYENGKLRDVNVVEVEGAKKMDLGVLCPVQDMTVLPYEIVNARMYDLLTQLVNDHRTTLIFTNTRSGTEHVSYKLKEMGIEDLAAHHGSLSKFIRLDVEERLKNGELKAVVSSTSLELGIDIGYIDLVCQIGSPKSIAKGLQRIGRSGHAVGDTSVGRMIVFDNDDLVECAALTKNAYDNHIDQVDIPTNSLDVLAQNIVGMSLVKRWEAEDAFKMVKRSYPYHNLKKKDFHDVLDYLAQRNPDVKVYAKIWYDKDDDRFGRKRGSRLIYFTNTGTIPEEGSYKVYSERGQKIGDLSEKFVEYLSRGDVFVLGGRTYQFDRVRGMRVFVKDASGRRPTVPSWTGEMLPRTFDLSIEVGKLRREIVERLPSGEGKTKKWLKDEYRLDDGSAQSVMRYVQEQQAVIADVPTDKKLLIEGHIDMKGNRNAIFHYSFGRRTNDALSRAYAFALTEKLGCNVRVSITDDNFMITAPKRFSLKDIHKMVTSKTLEDMLRRAIKNTELFKQRFRHCATRSFMVLRSYKGREVSMNRQQMRSEKVLEWFHEIEDFPVIKETYNEILNMVMDLKHAHQVLEMIESGEMEIATADFSNLPSPFAHNVVLLGISDVVLMEDRSALLRDFHRKILKRVISEDRMEEFQFQEEEIERFFRKKIPRIKKKDDIVSVIKSLGVANAAQQKGVSIHDYSDVDFPTLQKWSEELLQESKVASVWTPKGVLHCTKEDVPLFMSVYAHKGRLEDIEKKILNHLAKERSSTKMLSKDFKLDFKEMNEHLKKLERYYLIEREGLKDIIWKVRKTANAEFESSLDTIVKTYLGSKGPLTLSEVSFLVDMSEDVVKEVLQDLEREELVSSGHFVVGEDYQYMLTRDLMHLETGKEEEREVFDEKQITGFLLEKQFRQIESIDEYFETFLEEGMEYDIFNRVPSFSMREWSRKRKNGDILQGRFSNGRVCFITKEDAPLFVSAYRREEPNEFDEEVLDVLHTSDGMSLAEIVNKTREEKDRIKESIDNLDRNMYIVRKYHSREGWASKNIYIPFEVKGDAEDTTEKIILRFLKGYGPCSLQDIKGGTSFYYSEIETILPRLLEEGITERIWVGDLGMELWILSEDLEGLRKTEIKDVEDKMRVLSLYDPWIHPMWSQLVNRYGEGWYFPLIKDGKLCGMIEKWEMSGCVEVREIELEDEKMIPDLIEALDHMMKFFKKKGVEILRIRRAFGEDIAESEHLKEFLKNGYHQIGDFIAKGKFEPVIFDQSHIMSYIFWKQGIHQDTKFENVPDAIEKLGGLRSTFEANLKTRVPVPLHRLYDQGSICTGKAIPDYSTYTTLEELAVYKKAKNKKLTDYMKTVLAVVKDQEPVVRRKLFTLSPLGYGNTTESLHKLTEGLYVVGATSNGKVAYQSVPDHEEMTTTEARKFVLKRIIDSFGIFSAEKLSEYTGHEYKMEETRRILRHLEREGHLIKGFFVEGNDTLHWIVKEDLDRIGKIDFDGKFILTPRDNLAVYLRQHIRDKWDSGYRMVAFDGTDMIAAFKVRFRKNEIVMTDFDGDTAARNILKEFSIQNDIRIVEERREMDDWELVMWYDKMQGKES
ncbi:MAG: ATP-dependent helicase [Thermoplasmata archaeon]